MQPDLSYEGLFGVRVEDSFANNKKKGGNPPTTAAAPGSGGAPLAVSDFDVDVPWNIVETPASTPHGQSIKVFVGRIWNYGAAELRPDVDPARGAGYTLGFVQTLIKTTRASIYSEESARHEAYEARKDKIQAGHNRTSHAAGEEWSQPGIVEIEAGHKEHKANAPEYQRLEMVGGPLIDTLTGPSPWYDASQNLGLGAEGEAMMSDHPFIESPTMTPDGKGKLSRLAGKDSFLTNFIAMPPGGGAPLFLAHATWENVWKGEFDEGVSHFHGGKVNVTGEGKGKGGSPVLGGAPANTLSGTSNWSPAASKKGK